MIEDFDEYEERRWREWQFSLAMLKLSLDEGQDYYINLYWGLLDDLVTFGAVAI